jgi:FkbM family methyltransferase
VINEKYNLTFKLFHKDYSSDLLSIRNVNGVILNNQYHLTEKLLSGKVVFDVGANIGVFSLYSAKLGAKRVFAFEPVKETFDMLKKNIKENNLETIVVPINAAISDKSGFNEIFYNFPGDEGASIKFSNKLYSEKVVSISLDSFCKTKKITPFFIKIDTEGFEKQVLLGSSKLIKKNHPILCFSAYHYPSDYFELPKLVKKLSKNYTCTLFYGDEIDCFCEYTIKKDVLNG